MFEGDVIRPPAGFEIVTDPPPRVSGFAAAVHHSVLVVFDLVGKIPTTNASWCLAWALVFAAALDHYWTRETPDGSWLAFVGGIFGAVVLQHANKRWSWKSQPPSGPDAEDVVQVPEEEEIVRSEVEQEP